MLNVAVAKVRLQRPRVVPLVGERVAAGVPQHVWVCLKAQPRLSARPLDHAGNASGAEECLKLRSEYAGTTWAAALRTSRSIHSD